jgi:hypothetical protein
MKLPKTALVTSLMTVTNPSSLTLTLTLTMTPHSKLKKETPNAVMKILKLKKETPNWLKLGGKGKGEGEGEGKGRVSKFCTPTRQRRRQ